MAYTPTVADVATALAKYTAGTNWTWSEDWYSLLWCEDFLPKPVKYVEHTVGARLPPVYRTNFKPKCNGTDVRKDGRFA